MKRLFFKTRIKHARTYTQNQTPWKSVVGLEVHAQIQSRSKLFSGTSTNFTSPINTNVSLFDCAIPGTLPVLNKRCVEAAALTALALNCTVNPISMFDRKHYFYADMPAGYQITQQRSPLAVNGFLEFNVYTPGVHKVPYAKKVRIKQIQLEQDSAKSLHEEQRSLVDLNRAGVALMELVFEPDLSDGEEAAAMVKELSLILQTLKTCSCKMEEGNLRIDANVSVHKQDGPLGVRTEIKNIGSIRGVASAVKYEIQRQINLLNNKSVIINETRAWDALGKKTVPMRDKEEKLDYRYMPEPNLPPLCLAVGPILKGSLNVDDLKDTLPELPEQERERLQRKFGLSLEQSIILVNDQKLLNLFNDSVRNDINATLLIKIILNDLLTLINKEKLDVDNIKITGDHLSEITNLLENNIINRRVVKTILFDLLNGNSTSPKEIVKSLELTQITDENELLDICKKVVEENPKILKQYQAGKTKVFAAFLGIISNKTKQRADMKRISILLKDLLEKCK